MSVIAWDGSHLVADNQVTEGSVPKRIKKVFRSQRKGKKYALGFVGDAGQGAELVYWWRRGADEDDMPTCADTTLIVATADFCHCYDNGSPIPFVIAESYAAFGSGGSYADSALSLGLSAREAVLHAIENDIYCGMGTTSIKL